MVSIPGSRKINESEWTTISGNDTVEYNGFIGLPVKAFSGSTTSKFTVTSVYLEIECSSLSLTDTKTFMQSLEEPIAINVAGWGTFPNGTTSIVFPQPYPSTGHVTTFLFAANNSMNQFYSDIKKPLKIFYGSRTWAVNLNSIAETGGIRISLATCTMLPRGLETGLACTGEVCHAVAARKIPVPVKITSSITTIFRRGHFCGIGSSYHNDEASQTEHFLADGFIGDNSYSFRDLYLLPLAQFTERFQQVINTFWYASSTQAFSTGNFSSFSVRDHVLQTPAFVEEDLGLHYRCNWMWFWLAVVVIVLLESLAIVNALLRFQTKVPDVFGYVSSLTIDNSYCKGKDMEQSSALDGLQRARALGHVRFQLADVNGGDVVGKIAFVPRGVQDEIGATRVRSNRFYD
ncbi:hypothetical protein CGMCC3_g5423 [Colletotrichum fructicola]|nr:uncharacterized protein CGMCC3_g5423 [Colletotrichum fructicola]KAE9578500.1 hypothetical protein CGMCC3_g5423 [Colletotrichum fructicola]